MSKFEKGQSGNPNGRPKGSGRSNRFRDMIDKDVPALIKTVVGKAKDGDMVAMKICIDRIFPQTKARDELINIEKLDSQNLIEQANIVIKELSMTRITPSEASSVMNVLMSKAKLIETDELVQRVDAIEDKMSRG